MTKAMPIWRANAPTHEDSTMNLTTTETVAALSLKRPDLLRQAMLIDGEWVQADSGRKIDVRNPANGELVARVPDGGADETRRAIAAAERAFEVWKKVLPKERAKVMRRLFDLMVEHAD